MKNTAYAPGTHLLLDFFAATNLNDVASIERALQAAADACHATVLEIKLHSFGEGSGVTGVALLAESHISIHTWPETGFVALDVFVCGDCDAQLAVAPLLQAFQPGKMDIKTISRGKL
ncbi:MAG: adenosylmethionine decarboxylase [Ghiorsea sp.]